MAPSQRLIIPSRDPLPHSLRLPSTHPTLFKTLSRLSRASLLKLAQDWCSLKHRDNCGPYLNDDYEPDDPEVPWTAVNTIEELVELYNEELTSRKGSKRELLDRILEGDWRHGISLQQLAMADCQSLLDHPSALTWTAFKLCAYRDSDFKDDANLQVESIPQIHSSSFILSLHKQIAALTRAHYHVFRPTDLAVTIIRIALFDTPYADSSPSLTPDLIAASKSIFLAFPAGAPFVYVSLPVQAIKEIDAEARSLQTFIVKAVPAAISQPLERYELRPTQLTTRSLRAMLAMRGAGKEAGVNGGWSVYADHNSHHNALHVTSRGHDRTIADEVDEAEDEATKNVRTHLVKRTFDHSDPAGHLPLHKRKQLKALTSGRFGQVGTHEDTKILTRLDINLKEGIDMNSHWRPSIRLTFQGANIFQGLRELTEAAVIDAANMPAWMIGEANSSTITVSNGKATSWTNLEG